MIVSGALLLFGLILIAVVVSAIPAARRGRRENCPRCRSEDIVVYGEKPLGTCLACGSEFEFEFRA